MKNDVIMLNVYNNVIFTLNSWYSGVLIGGGTLELEWSGVESSISSTSDGGGG